MLEQYPLYLMPRLARMTSGLRLSLLDTAETLRSYFPPD